MARIGNAYRRMGQNDLAAKHFAFAVQLASKPLSKFPDSYRALRERCWIRAVANIETDAALADCDHSLKSKPNDSDTLSAKGFVLYRQGKYQEAVEAYDQALAARSKNADALLMRGMAKQKLDDAIGATSDVKAATDLDHRIVVAYLDYGIVPPSN